MKPSAIPSSWMGAGTPRNPAASLTPRQRQVLRLLAEGLTQKEVAAEMGITANTVRNHLAEAYRGLGIEGSWGSHTATITTAFRRLGWLHPVAITAGVTWVHEPVAEWTVVA